jgi:hypothetical protein
LQRGAPSASDDGVVRRVPMALLDALVTDRLQSLSISGDAGALRRVELKSDGVDLVLDLAELGGASAFDRRRAKLGPTDRVELDHDLGLARVRIAMRPVFRGGRTWLIGPTGAGVVRRAALETDLAKALRVAHVQQLGLDASPMTSVEQLAQARAPADSYYRRRGALAFLAPDIQRAILAGEVGLGLDVAALVRGEIPLAWADQRRHFGL